MAFIAFLIIWLPQPDPTYHPKAAFIKDFPTYALCEEYRERLVDPIQLRTSTCVLWVVEPKKGIAE